MGSRQSKTIKVIRSLVMSDKDLRNEVIRLAHSNPKLREHLLPLLKESATKSQSFSLMQSYRSMYGDSTANYYKA